VVDALGATVNLSLTEDDNGSFMFALTDANGPLNLTSADVFAVIKASQHVEDDAASGVYTLTEGSGVTIVDAAAGTVRIDIPDAVSASPSIWFYKIRATISGDTRTAITGWLSISDA
jgi:hypothetical protein